MSHILSFKLLLYTTLQVSHHDHEDERRANIEGNTNFSRRLKQFGGLNGLTLTPQFYDRSTPLIRATLFMRL